MIDIWKSLTEIPRKNERILILNKGEYKIISSNAFKRHVFHHWAYVEDVDHSFWVSQKNYRVLEELKKFLEYLRDEVCQENIKNIINTKLYIYFKIGSIKRKIDVNKKY